MARVRHELPGITVSIADHPQRASSTIAAVGGYVVIVATAVPRLGVTLTSVYVGQLGAETGATHLALLPDEPPTLTYRLRPAAEPGATRHARGCLLDHAAELQELLGRGGDTVAIAVSAEALELASAVWPDAPAA